ncbi:Positive regulator of Tartrate dehydrogenase/decarboxylase/D-malic enzyme [Klebsiella pneumoniae ISC21]|nr:Positive regulator of Tartrate dehydrogenase/decarboxylase/D-malic enzyme [Klebsiella pneumoniae ISC21]
MKHKTQIMNNLPLLNDLRVFMLVARRAGFAAAAEELGVSPASSASGFRCWSKP